MPQKTDFPFKCSSTNDTGRFSEIRGANCFLLQLILMEIAFADPRPLAHHPSIPAVCRGSSRETQCRGRGEEADRGRQTISEK